jgi:hypothetical protein
VSRGPYGAALRVVDTAGASGNSPAFALAAADSDSPRALIRPSRRCSARDKGKPENQKHNNRFQVLFEGDFLRLVAAQKAFVMKLPAQAF